MEGEKRTTSVIPVLQTHLEGTANKIKVSFSPSCPSSCLPVPKILGEVLVVYNKFNKYE